MTYGSFTIALDGPAAAGKGTISKALAQHFGFAHLDTGLIYRAVGRRVAQGQDPVEAARSLCDLDFTNIQELRTSEASEHASIVASNPLVREELVDFQRKFSRQKGGAILDGRDIGTVICPDAEVKFFVTASDEIRAQRRHQELLTSRPNLKIEEVLVDIKRRDERDRLRDTAPMTHAKDALLLDTTKLSIDAAVAKAVQFVEQKLTF